MWKASNGKSDIYLFGTLHVLHPATRWRTPAYDAVYAKAQVIWFEADLSGADARAVNELINHYGVDPDRPLSQKLSPADLLALRREADVAHIDHLRPWAAALMLSMQPALAQGAKVASGADLAVTRLAQADAKPTRYFETIEDQARLFAGLSEPAELRYLTEVIHERAHPAKSVLGATTASMERQWVNGDLAKLAPTMVGDLARNNPALYDALLKRRNLAWADTLAGELAEGGRKVELVNVGALHMVGPDGLPALLKARGFAVQRVQ